MRHIIHINFSEYCDEMLTKIASYVMQNGGEDNGDYSQFFQITDKGNHYLNISKIKIEKKDETFLSFEHIDEVYSASFELFQDYDSENKLISFFTNLFNSTITINKIVENADLLYIFYVPVFRKDISYLVHYILNALAKSNKPASIDIIALSSDCATLFSNEEDKDKMYDFLPLYNENQKVEFRQLKVFRKEFSHIFKHLYFFQNCQYSAISLDLNIDLISKIFGDLSILMQNNYKQLYCGIDKDLDKIQVFGLSVLYLDKKYFREYMLQHIFYDAVLKENIQTKELDINIAENCTQHILNKYKGLLNDIYENEIVPKYKNNKLINEIIDEIIPIIDSKIETIKEDSIHYFSRSDLDLPQKKAVLSCLMGLDDALFVGNSLGENQLVFDDLYEDSIDSYISINNMLLQFKASDQTSEDFSSYAVLSIDKEPVVNPYPQLKAVKRELMSSTSYIRTLKDEQKRLEKNIETKENAAKIFTAGKIIIHDEEYKLLPIDEEDVSLDETYIPGTTKIRDIVDMRSKMSSVKNQGTQGSCLAHALVGVYEYIFGCKEIPNNRDFSEAYLYYNTRKKQGDINKDSGSTLTFAIEALVQYGLCKEELFPYDDKTYSHEPSEEAYQDGVNRKLLVAKNVNLKEKDIKSALCEGYPVACSLMIYESFSKSYDSGLVTIPEKAEIERGNLNQDHGRHAMLLCGYDDRRKFFICRNSWGKTYGDSGYCYIPYNYILDDNLTNYACILQTISGDNIQYIVPENQLQVNLKGTEIQIFVNKSIIAYCESSLTYLLNRKDELQEKYTTLKQRLKDGNVQSELHKGAEKLSSIQHKKVESTLKDVATVREPVSIPLSKKLSNFFFSFSFAIIPFLLSLGAYILNIFHKFSDPKFLLISWIFFTFLLIFSGISSLKSHIYLKRKRKSKNVKIEKVNNELKEINEEGDLCGIKLNIAGKLLTKLFRIQNDLEAKIDVVSSFMNNIEYWIDNESNIVKSQAPYLSLVDDVTLDYFYSLKKEELLSKLNLSSMVKDYGVSLEEINKFQMKLKEELLILIDSYLDDFNMYSCITNNTAFQYTGKESINLAELLQNSSAKADVFARLNKSLMCNMKEYSMIFLKLKNAVEVRDWDKKYKGSFSQMDLPVTIPETSDERLILMKICSLTIDSIYDLTL